MALDADAARKIDGLQSQIDSLRRLIGDTQPSRHARPYGAGGGGNMLTVAIVEAGTSDRSVPCSVRELIRNDSDPWDGGYELTGEAFDAYPWPHTAGERYGFGVYDAATFSNSMIWAAVEIGGFWLLMPNPAIRAFPTQLAFQITEGVPTPALDF